MLSTGTTNPNIMSLPFRTVVSFRSKRAGDTTLYMGTLISTGVYDSYDDDGSIQPYNEAVRQSDPSVPSDYTQLDFFELKISNNGTTRRALFAKEWIATQSLQVISQAIVRTVQVTDPYNDPDRLANYIRSGGYTAKITG